jgi:hypothetical protein
MAAQEKREFSVSLMDGNTIKLTTRTPVNQELQDADFEYSKSFNKGIMNGILPQSRLMAAFVENGVWDKDKEAQVLELRNKVAKLEDDLAQAPEADKVIVAKAVRFERDKLFTLRQEKNDLLSHSAEAKADESQRNHIVSRVTELAASGVRVWPTYRDFIEEKDGNLVFRAVYEYLTYANGLNSNFAAELPENKVLETDAKSSEQADAPAEATALTEVKPA